MGGTLLLTICFPFVLDPCLTLPTFYLVLCAQEAALWAPHQLENGEDRTVRSRFVARIPLCNAARGWLSPLACHHTALALLVLELLTSDLRWEGVSGSLLHCLSHPIFIKLHQTSQYKSTAFCQDPHIKKKKLENCL